MLHRPQGGACENDTRQTAAYVLLGRQELLHFSPGHEIEGDFRIYPLNGPRYMR